MKGIRNGLRHLLGIVNGELDGLRLRLAQDHLAVLGDRAVALDLDAVLAWIDGNVAVEQRQRHVEPVDEDLRHGDATVDVDAKLGHPLAEPLGVPWRVLAHIGCGVADGTRFLLGELEAVDGLDEAAQVLVAERDVITHLGRHLDLAHLLELLERSFPVAGGLAVHRLVEQRPRRRQLLLGRLLHLALPPRRCGQQQRER